ncbi:MAG: hypothetical protein NT030_06925 [Candidatus Saganbacteria bacterium]|nr:hypothetical protein [Candidatus Saganbacteria bacterium]
MKIDDNKKVDVLLSALEERYNSIHKIRERVQSIGIWALGLLLGAGGWLMQSNIILTAWQKAIAILVIIGAFAFLRFDYLNDLRRGFNGQQQVAVRLERALCLYTQGIYDDSDEPIYPKSWEGAGMEISDGKFFDSTCNLLYVGVAFLLITILLNGCFSHC